MDLRELCGMPRVTGGKAPSTRPTAREVGASPAREVPRASLKRPAPPPPEQAEDAGRHQKKTKVLTRKHKSRVGEGESRSCSKGKEPAVSSEEPEAPVGSEEGGASPVHERWSSDGPSHQGNCPGKLLDSCLGNVSFTLLLDPNSCPFVHDQHFQMALVDRVHDAGRLITFMDYRVKQLQEELDALKSRGGPEAVAEVEERASRLREELEKIKGGKAEELLRCEASEKELQAVWAHLGDAQQLLKEARTRARRMDDELLQAVKDLESARAELPEQAVARYKGSLGFKEGLKRMGRVTYEYGYRVALARFRARYPDVDVEEDPFTIYPEYDMVPMERQHDFDDSVPPEP
ncbi:hypothetical protein B296_00059264 [Ensete ventricosum]|uniref:Uncharacterized protein n=1 Tax=Ensete ventricosum TaxID=4639 RepID=A0A426WV68_ENSVE|nr:hypothetical protein B296_00059264 [Ensete ventricosum]